VKFWGFVCLLTCIISLPLVVCAEVLNSVHAQVESAGVGMPVTPDFKVSWRYCGDWNAWYWHATHEVTICEEYFDEDHGLEVARFALLHELGHAYTFQRGVDFGRWRGNYEASADEFAAVVDVLEGHPDDLTYKADLFEAWGRTHTHNPSDPHPAPQVRADTLRCLYIGFKNLDDACRIKWEDALAYWTKTWRDNP
jgi:hypothetical protein